jgi:hypothetical protein
MSRIALLLALSALTVSAQAPKGEGKKGAPGPQPQMIQQVKPGFYVVTGGGGWPSGCTCRSLPLARFLPTA